jgi:hypothetical protein
MEHAIVHELVDRVTALEGGVQLDEGVRPQLAVGEVPVHLGANPVVTDHEEALDVLFVVADEVVAKTEDVHAITSRLDARSKDSNSVKLTCAERASGYSTRD